MARENVSFEMENGLTEIYIILLVNLTINKCLKQTITNKLNI